MKKEYVERDKVLTIIKLNGRDFAHDSYQDICELPAADVVKVIRCRYCIHSRVNGDKLLCIASKGKVGVVDPMDYCSAGELRSNIILEVRNED